MHTVMPSPERTKPPYSRVWRLVPSIALVVAVLATAGCAGSLMHSGRSAAMRDARTRSAPTPAPEALPIPGLAASAATLASVPVPPPAVAAEGPATQPPAPPSASPPEPEHEAIVVTGLTPRKPPPPVYPNTSATIAFAVHPAENCPTCRNLKITVSPTGQVLIELGSWDDVHRDWKYQRSRAKVSRNTANAFAASLDAVRPVGAKALHTGGVACAAAQRDEGLTIEWIEFGHRDQLDVTFDCADAVDGPAADRLRHAPDVLGLRRVAAP